jgi:hypothetical protein
MDPPVMNPILSDTEELGSGQAEQELRPSPSLSPAMQIDAGDGKTEKVMQRDGHET